MDIHQKLAMMAQEEREVRRIATAKLFAGDLQGAKEAAIGSLQIRREILNKTIDRMNGFEEEPTNGHDRAFPEVLAPLQACTDRE